MSIPIQAIAQGAGSIGSGLPAVAPAASPEGLGESFGRLLEAASASDAGANTAVGKMLDGSGDVHEAMIALQQADLMLQFTVQVRNKIVQAYQDIMRMPV